MYRLNTHKRIKFYQDFKIKLKCLFVNVISNIHDIQNNIQDSMRN